MLRDLRVRVVVDRRRYICRSILAELFVAGNRPVITRSLRMFRVDLLKSRQHICGPRIFADFRAFEY